MSENNNVTEHDVELGKFKILAPIEYTDENGERMGDLEVGSIQEVPVDLGNGWVEAGLAEVFVEPVEEDETNEYVLKGFKDTGDQYVYFYEMLEDGNATGGTTLEEMIRVTIHRLTVLNERFPSEYNKKALSALKEARHQLDERTRDRVARGVEGKHEA